MKKKNNNMVGARTRSLSLIDPRSRLKVNFKLVKVISDFNLSNTGTWSQTLSVKFVEYQQTGGLQETSEAFNLDASNYAAGAFRKDEIIEVGFHSGRFMPRHKWGGLVAVTVVDAFGTTDASTNCNIVQPHWTPDIRGAIVTAYNVKVTSAGSNYGMEGSSGEEIWCSFLSPGNYQMIQKGCA